MHILVVAHNFHPEYNAGAIRTYVHCRRWVERGATVTVVTLAPNFPLGQPFAGYKNKYRLENIDGIKVVRVRAFLAPNRGVWLRSLSYFSFAWSSFFAGLCEPADVVIATSPQLLAGLSGWLLAAVKRKPFIFEVRDLWPDGLIAIDMMGENIFVHILRILEHLLYRKAKRIVAVTKGIQQIIARRCGDPGKVSLIYNGVDKRLYQAVPPPANPDTFVVGYIGTLGFMQGLDVVLNAAARLKGKPVHIVLVGDGGNRANLIAKAATMQLDNVTFRDAVPRAAIPQEIAACDAVLVPLRDHPLLQHAIPSKLFAAAAMERPIIASLEGDAAELLRLYGAGVSVKAGDDAALAEAILAMKNDPAARERAAEGGRRLAADFERNHLADQMLDLIRDTAFTN